MANGALSFFTKVGLVGDEMVPPRTVTGFFRVLVSVVAVAFSYFFIHISFFGPPVAEVFKGTFLLGVSALSILLYKSRQRSLRQGFVWLDEFFALIDLVGLCAMMAVGIYWWLFDTTELWLEFADADAWMVAALGGIAGLALYAYEAIRERRSDNPSLSDILYLAGLVAALAWWMSSNVELTERIGGPVPAPVVFFSGILVAVSFDVARRVTGPIIPLIGFLFFIYSFEPVAQSMPGLLFHLGFRIDRVMEFLMLSSDGMTGLIVEVFATYIVIFVILGAFLEKTGLGALIIDTAYRLTGRRTGGPGLAAVVSSGLFGMISGSAVANVVTVGTFTIPLMKRVGYKPQFAGAVEAAASNGGAYMPPVMGAGAFLLAELTETSYLEVVKIATIPALLYYLSVASIVYFRARRRGLVGVPVEELPPWERIVPRLHMLLPIPAMIYFLVIGDSAFLAAAKTIVLIVMLRTADLLAAIRTPWSGIGWRYYLPFSLTVGVLVYLFGMAVGAPFTWFVDDYLGITAGDALYWAVFAFIVLKLGEVLAAGSAARMHGLPQTSWTADHAPQPTRAGAGASLRAVSGEVLTNVWTSMEAGAKNLLVVGCIAGVLGILLSGATQSALPGRVSGLLVAWSFGILPLTIFWVIVAGYVVGLGLPITASYVILAIFAVGALTDLGVPVMTAHLISFWVAVVSAVTPPVAVASYAAAAIAGSDPVKTSNESMRLASMIFIMPVMFVYTPILLNGTPFDIVVTVIGAVLGVIAWAAFLEGFTFRLESPLERSLYGAAAACLLLPVDRIINEVLGVEQKLFYETYAIGAVLMATAFVFQRLRHLRPGAEPAGPEPAE